MRGRQLPPSAPRTDVPEAVRVQILATEHWSLLATRSITYGAIYSRATIFLTVVSAAVIALALAAEATEFGDRFYVGTAPPRSTGCVLHREVGDVRPPRRRPDRRLLAPVRHESPPSRLSRHLAGARAVFRDGPSRRPARPVRTTENRVLRLIASTSTVVGVIDAVLAGVVGGLVAKVVGAGSELSLLIGAVVTSVVVALLVHADRRIIARGRRRLEPRFARSAEAGRARTAGATVLSSADVPQSVRAQILATEHWSLLAARDVTYRAVFSRAAIFLTVVSAAVVALALVARATEFGDRFTAFALLVLPVALFVGVATYIRLIEARIDDFWLLSGMNRLRHAYLEIAPGLEPYFVTGHHDDEQGLHETYGPGTGAGSTA